MNRKLRRSIEGKLQRWNSPHSRTRKRFEKLLAAKDPEIEALQRLFAKSRDVDMTIRVTI